METKITYFHVVLGAVFFQLALLMYSFYYMYIKRRFTGSPWRALILILMVIGETILRTALTVLIADYLDAKLTGMPLSPSWLSYAAA